MLSAMMTEADRKSRMHLLSGALVCGATYFLLLGLVARQMYGVSEMRDLSNPASFNSALVETRTDTSDAPPREVIASRK